MKKPITLYIPQNYHHKHMEDNYIKYAKTNPLTNKMDANGMFIASIEKVENYKCTIKHLPENDRETITENFKSAKLSLKIADCHLYGLNWSNFIVHWIQISEAQVLQLIRIVTKPQYLAYQTTLFTKGFYKTEVDKNYDYSTVSDIEKVFDVQFLKEKKNENENILKTTDANFLTLIKNELKEKEETKVEAFICADWNMFYNLYNPENFSDPNSTLHWEDNSGVFDYYEKPFTDNTSITLVYDKSEFDSTPLENLLQHKEVVEQNLLNIFENYTFGNGGAYADDIHYSYAKTEIERLHNTTYTNQEFLKQNLCLKEIIFNEHKDVLKLYFQCSWDTEHGIVIQLNRDFECIIE